MRLIDADELKDRLKEYCIDGDTNAGYWYSIMGIDDCINNAPTIDAVEVVRCKECKWYQQEIGNPWGICFNPNKCTKRLGFQVIDNDYCGFGERREDE